MADRVEKIQRIVLVNVTAGDVDITDKLENCRAIWSDTGGRIRIQIRDYYEGKLEDHILELSAGSWTQVGNVSKVYRYLTGETVCESQVVNLTNTLVNGIKLGF
jgi:hypothetical protein